MQGVGNAIFYVINEGLDPRSKETSDSGEEGSTQETETSGIVINVTDE